MAERARDTESRDGPIEAARKSLISGAAADPDIAKTALGRGACVLVYPGGDVETHRPWTARNEVRFDGRKGFLRLAQEAGVPIVPVVAVGGQETFIPLTDGRRLARTLRL